MHNSTRPAFGEGFVGAPWTLAAYAVEVSSLAGQSAK